MDEGHDARLLRFSPTADFQGGHRQEQINYRTVAYIHIERTYNCETSSFGRKVSRRKAVLLLVFSCSVADYEKPKGF